MLITAAFGNVTSVSVAGAIDARPRKHKDGLRWYKTVLNHLIPSKRLIKTV